MGGNPFFTQLRPGKNEKIFKLIKFRTMTHKCDENGTLLPDKDRLTTYGRLLRALSLDEIPQLFNIFLGQMSIIGPRPLLIQYLPLYNQEQKKRHKVRPGLTGLAQVSGRNAISWRQKFEKDIQYVNAISFFGDIKIFLATIGKVFKRDGISQKNNVTMEAFEGNMKLAIYGAGALGREVYDLVLRNCSDKYEEIFFVDDMSQENMLYGVKVIQFNDLKNTEKIEFAVATGEPFVRQALREKIETAGFSLATIIDKSAVISPTAKLSQGVVVHANCFVSSDSTIGTNVYLQPMCTVAHDSAIGADCVISSFCQISGACRIGDTVYMGLCSSLRENINIGSGVIVGMGSFVHADVEDLMVVLGNPAQAKRKNENRRVFFKMKGNLQRAARYQPRKE